MAKHDDVSYQGKWMNIIISSTRKMDSNISTLAQTQKFHLKSAKHGISDANLTTAIK